MTKIIIGNDFTTMQITQDEAQQLLEAISRLIDYGLLSKCLDQLFDNNFCCYRIVFGDSEMQIGFDALVDIEESLLGVA